MSGSWGRPDPEEPTPNFSFADVKDEPLSLPDSWGAPRSAQRAAIEQVEREQKWDSRGLGLALEVSTWSSCTRDQVGAVVLSASHDVVSTGFNDTAAGLPNCGQGGCPRASREGVVPGQAYEDQDECLHAEDNALQRAGLSARGATLYVTRPPCGTCARRAKTAGIVRTVVIDPEDLARIRSEQ